MKVDKEKLMFFDDSVSIRSSATEWLVKLVVNPTFHQQLIGGIWACLGHTAPMSDGA